MNYALGEETYASTDGSTLLISTDGSYHYAWWDWLTAPAFGEFFFDFHTGDNGADLFAYIAGTADTAVDTNDYSMSAWLYSNGDGTWRLYFIAGIGAVEDHNITFEAATWYRVRITFDPNGGFYGFKTWKRGSEAEPANYLYEGTPLPRSFSGPGGLEIDCSATSDMRLDNLTVYEVGTGPVLGCRELEINFDAGKMENDALIWGAGQGSPNPVFSRVEDATSESDHGRWQVGAFLPTIWHQATVERIANSHVYGSPQSKRGGKDDRVAVRLVTFDGGNRVADKATVTSAVWNYSDVLPIREMTLTFPSAIPRYEFGLSHSVDLPWSTFEYWFPKIEFTPPIFHWPTLPRFDPCSASCEDAMCDDFNRVVASGWGGGWVTVSDPSGTTSVDGTRGVATSGSAAMRMPITIAGYGGITITGKAQFGAVSPTTGVRYQQIGVTDAALSGSPSIRMDITRYGSAHPTYPDETHVQALAYDADGNVFSGLETTVSVNPAEEIAYRFEVFNGAFRARIWESATNEPMAWYSPASFPLAVEEVFALADPNLFVVEESSGLYVDDICYQLCTTVGEAMGLFAFDSFDRVKGPFIVADGASSFSWNAGDSRVGPWDAAVASGGTWGVDGSVGVDGDAAYADLSPAGQVYLTSAAIAIGHAWVWETQFSVSRVPVVDSNNDTLELSIDLIPDTGPTAVFFAEIRVTGPRWTITGGGDNSFTFNDDVIYHVKVKVDLDSATQYAKVWNDSQAEPDWQDSASISGFDPNQDAVLFIRGNNNALFETGLFEWKFYDINDSPCDDPDTAEAAKDPPQGGYCEVIAESASVPPAYDSADHFYYTRTAFTPNTTRVYVNGVFMRRGIDYAEGDPYYGNFVVIDSTINVTDKTVQVCFDADPERTQT